MSIARSRTPALQTGSSLLEVLVAILIISFGLLALGGLTAVNQQHVKMTQFQSIGVQLASELGERMRGNVTAFELGAYNKTTVYASAEVEVPACSVTPCSPADIAARDIAQWTNTLRQSLPGGDAFVQRDPVNPLATDIWVIWIDPDLRDTGGSDGSVASAADCPAGAVTGLAATIRPRCMHYRISL
ncbi:MAG: type IV pilus modification protein PilV [Variovorax sp.]